jgi:heptosyltransferase-1
MSLERPPSSSSVSRILVTQLWPFGDVFLATSYLEALKERFPSARISFLVGRPFAVVPARHPFVDEVIAAPAYRGAALYLTVPILVGRVRRRRFDLVLDQQGSTVSRLVTVLSGAATRVGMAGRSLERHLDMRAPLRWSGPAYGAYRNFDLVAPLGISPPGTLRMHFTLNDDDRRFVSSFLDEAGIGRDDYIVVAPGSKDARKRWHVEGFAGVARRIREEMGFRTVIVYAPDERPAAEELLRRMGEGGCLAPPTSLPRAIALVESARFLLCNDCALNHLSTTLATPALALFGKAPPSRWSPASVFAGKRHLYKDPRERAPGNHFGISVDEAFATAAGLLGG